MWHRQGVSLLEQAQVDSRPLDLLAASPKRRCFHFVHATILEACPLDSWAYDMSDVTYTQMSPNKAMKRTSLTASVFLLAQKASRPTSRPLIAALGVIEMSFGTRGESGFVDDWLQVYI